MLDIHFIRENKEKVQKAIEVKHSDCDLNELLKVDEERRHYIQRVEEARAQQNVASTEIAQISDEQIRAQKIEEMQHVKRDLEDSEGHLKDIEQRYVKLMKSVPNIPYDDVPIGRDESFNVVLREEGKKPNFSFTPQDYLSLAQSHGWIDIERAAKISGSRFGYIKGDLALVEFALVQYAMKKLSREGFVPVVPPVFIKPEFMDAMGFLHGDLKDDVYFLEQDQLYLVGTSEQSIGPMHAGETLLENTLPLRYAGFSTCFRREAGSYGRDTKGILRVHQFDKVEMVSFCSPEKSREEHKYLLSLEEEIMRDLELPYRVVHIATGDMGLPKAEQFDIETWIPSEGCYRETHSASNITDFQARRLRLKLKKEDDTTSIPHMLNATAIAMPRMLIALIENFQQEDGSVRMPKVLAEFLGTKKIPH